MDKAEKLKLFSRFNKWYHTMSLGDGIITPGDPGNNRMKWKAISGRLPVKVEGKTFIDLGPAEGYFSIKMLQKGASSGVCVERNEKMINKLEFCMKCIFGKIPDGLKIVRMEIDDLMYNDPVFRDSLGIPSSWDYSIALAIAHWVNDPLVFAKYLAKITRLKSFVEIVVNDVDEYGISTKRAKKMFKWDIGKEIFKNMSRCAGFKHVISLKDYVTSFGSHRALYELSK